MDFQKSLKVDCTTADTSVAIAGMKILEFGREIEGQDLVRLGYGTTGAKSTTLSFYVKSSKTGTCISFWCQDPNETFQFKQYTISVADTWERKTVTIPGDMVELESM